jgi:hypothetical protein
MHVLYMLTGLLIGAGIGHHFGAAHGKSRAMIALWRLRAECPTATLDSVVYEVMKS